MPVSLTDGIFMGVNRKKKQELFILLVALHQKRGRKNDKRRHKWRLSVLYTLFQPQEQAKNETINWVLNVHEDSSSLTKDGGGFQ